MKICSFSGLHSSIYAPIVKFVRATGDITKGRQHHLSQNIGLAVARSAAPAPPALYDIFFTQTCKNAKK